MTKYKIGDILTFRGRDTPCAVVAHIHIGDYTAEYWGLFVKGKGKAIKAFKNKVEGKHYDLSEMNIRFDKLGMTHLQGDSNTYKIGHYTPEIRDWRKRIR